MSSILVRLFVRHLCIGIYVIHAFVNHTEVAGWASLILSIWLVGAMLMIQSVQWAFILPKYMKR